LFAVSGFGISGVDFSGMTLITIFGLTSCVLLGDSVGFVRAFYGKIPLLQVQNTVIYGYGSGSAGQLAKNFVFSHTVSLLPFTLHRITNPTSLVG
jgi:hypothetical protein